MRQYVTYQTRQPGETKWRDLPNPVPVEPLPGESAKDCFRRVFLGCFGDSLEYRIVSIDDKRNVS